MIRFVAHHLAEIAGGLAVSWGLFALGIVWERETHEPEVIFYRIHHEEPQLVTRQVLYNQHFEDSPI